MLVVVVTAVAFSLFVLTSLIACCYEPFLASLPSILLKLAGRCSEGGTGPQATKKGRQQIPVSSRSSTAETMSNHHSPDFINVVSAKSNLNASSQR